MNHPPLSIKQMRFLLLIGMLSIISACKSLDRLTTEKITEQKGWYTYASWSPDGTSIIYRTGLGEQFEILNLISGDVEAIPIPQNPDDGTIGVEWIDETKIMYFVASRDDDEVLRRFMIYDLVTHEEQVHSVFIGNAYSFCWNQAAKTPVVVGTKKPHNISAPIYGKNIFTYDSKNEDWTAVYQVDTGYFLDGIDGIACHPFEDRIAFVEVTRTPDTPGNDSSLFLIDENRENPQLIFEETSKGKFDGPTWSPDGQWIAVHAYSDWKGRQDGITLVPIGNNEANEEKTIWLLTGFIGDISWSPTENVVLLRSGGELIGGFDLYRFDLSPWLDETD